MNSFAIWVIVVKPDACCCLVFESVDACLRGVEGHTSEGATTTGKGDVAGSDVIDEFWVEGCVGGAEKVGGDEVVGRQYGSAMEWLCQISHRPLRHAVNPSSVRPSRCPNPPSSI
jgi:hypothetical protein